MGNRLKSLYRDNDNAIFNAYLDIGAGTISFIRCGLIVR